jgi:hypothetical protein
MVWFLCFTTSAFTHLTKSTFCRPGDSVCFVTAIIRRDGERGGIVSSRGAWVCFRATDGGGSNGADNPSTRGDATLPELPVRPPISYRRLGIRDRTRQASANAFAAGMAWPVSSPACRGCMRRTRGTGGASPHGAYGRYRGGLCPARSQTWPRRQRAPRQAIPASGGGSDRGSNGDSIGARRRLVADPALGRARFRRGATPHAYAVRLVKTSPP